MSLGVLVLFDETAQKSNRNRKKNMARDVSVSRYWVNDDRETEIPPQAYLYQPASTTLEKTNAVQKPR